jgi:hypothetical protein
MRRNNDAISRLVTGALILATGVIFWLHHLDRLDASEVFRWWSVALIVSGAGHLVQRRWMSATLLTIFGVAFLPPVRMVTGFHVWQIFAFTPLLISVAGVTLVAQALRPKPKTTFRALAFMAGNVRTIATHDFPGGDVIAVMGGCELNLTGVPRGHEVVLDLLVFWGGMEIRIPRGWRVENHAVAILAGIEDKTTTPANADAPRLVLRGSVIMGGIEVKNTSEETT